MRHIPGVGPLKVIVPVLFQVGVASLFGGAFASDDFNHESHGALFASCADCHQPGLAGLYTIDQAGCSRCHDGIEIDKVEWRRPERPPHNLRFDHLDHPLAYLEEGEELECGECHQVSSDSQPMEVSIPAAARCLECHDEDPNQHFTPGTPCGSCHLALPEATGLSLERIANFPEPEVHRSEDFIGIHGSLAEEYPESCATCHARQSCERCHANADQVTVINRIERDARVASLVAAREGAWPVPESHTNPSWWIAHGDSGSETENCSNCHSSSSCSNCHTRDLAQLGSLPVSSKSGMPLLPLRPRDHATDFVQNHGGSASVRDCSTCHQEQFCTDCHQGEQVANTVTGGYHPSNFVVHHATSAFGPDAECSDCHSTTVFCRDCHRQSGISPTASRGNVYHDAQPMWLLSHGEAARQGLDACVTCHQQSDCLQCHSARSGWGVSPHGPDFVSAALSGANKKMCLACHPRSFVQGL